MGLFDIFTGKKDNKAIPYNIKDPQGQRYIQKEEDTGIFKFWYVIPIVIILIGVLAVFDIGPFSGNGLFNPSCDKLLNETSCSAINACFWTNTTHECMEEGKQIICGDNICQSQFENINTCKQDCDPNYVSKEEPFSLVTFVLKNWIAILIIAFAIWWFVIRPKSDISDTKSPKIFTLEECRETAEKILQSKGFDNYLPTFHYRNRPDIYGYRYLYKEVKYPGINDHRGGGFKEHNRGFFKIEIGYDNELNYFDFTDNEDEAISWVDSKEKISSGYAAREYRMLRERSGRPMTKTEERIRELEEKYGHLRNQRPEYGSRYPSEQRDYNSPYGYEERQ